MLIHFFCVNDVESLQSGTEYFVVEGIISAVIRVKSVEYKIAYIIQSSCWCGIRWNVDVLTDDNVGNHGHRQLKSM
jgi:hypothetical protein